MIAQTTSLGNITESSRNNNLSQFKKEINRFKEKINYYSAHRILLPDGKTFEIRKAEATTVDPSETNSREATITSADNNIIPDNSKISTLLTKNPPTVSTTPTTSPR